MTRFLSITFCSSLAIFAGGLIAMMLGVVEIAPWSLIIMGVSAVVATVSLFRLDFTGELSK